MAPCCISSCGSKLGRVGRVMTMGLSTQTGPLRPSCPSHSFFSQSCSRLSSLSFSWSLLASSKALHRRGGCTIHNNKNYQTMSHGWRLVCLSNSAKMVFYSRDQDNSNGSILKNPIIDPRNVDKEGEKVSRNSSAPPVQEFQGSNPERPSAFVTVDESTEPCVFRERKEQSKGRQVSGKL
ncbi:uncharacterized protein LOC132176513 [Corylus avellana]|uniref:uncharacterized protein LOC132176513 n=1 Tax=Corylus avellana TaxID=13451 RepID=UPI00286C7EB5|nr:uncharacterized protein LOC132176513 [Corylus avellana]